MDVEQVVDPYQEARERTNGAFESRVLEPSPPPITEPPWFADDPVNGGGGSNVDLPVLAPVHVPDATYTWSDWVGSRPELVQFCADRWLGACRSLPIPDNLEALARTRRSWHVLAEHALAPARHRATGKIGLRFTRAGFGTPFFGADEQVRVAGSSVIVIRGEDLSVHPITTLRAAADAIGIEPGAPSDVYTPATALDRDAPLRVDSDAARLLGDWFGFGASVLEELRAGASPADAPARVQLWPEHFDISVDLGEESAGRRATFGASPGDDDHALPYVYVTPWTEQVGSFWNERTFASLGLREFADTRDQRRAVLDFFARARHALTS